MNLPSMLRQTGAMLSRNSPAILTGFSAIGVVGTAVLAADAATKAERLRFDIEEEHEKFGNGEELSEKEIFKRVAPLYIPALIMGGMTVVCILASSAIQSRRNTVLAGLYSASELALKEYQHKVVEVIGDKKEREVRDEIAKDRLAKNPVTSNQVIITGKGDALCYDSLSGRYFTSDIESIRRVENTINRRIISEMWVPVNDLYYELHLSNVDSGARLGWNSDKRLEFDFSSQLSEDGRPCLVLNYVWPPCPNYTM